MSARSAISTDHDELLDRVLPHVETGVITKARLIISEDADWDDDEGYGDNVHDRDGYDDGYGYGYDDDDDDEYGLGFDLQPSGGGRRGGGGGLGGGGGGGNGGRASARRTSISSIGHRSAHTRTNSTSDFSDFTYAGRSAFGGLSPPRRPTAFSNFDSGFAEMAESNLEDEGVEMKHANGGGGGFGSAGGGGIGGGGSENGGVATRSTNTRTTAAEAFNEPGLEPPRKTPSRAASQVANSRASSPGLRAREDGGGGGGGNGFVVSSSQFEVPVRQSSRGGDRHANNNGLGDGGGVGTRELASGSIRARGGHLRIEPLDDESEDEDDLNDGDSSSAHHLQGRLSTSQGPGAKASSDPFRSEGSSTPPPISHVRPARRVVPVPESSSNNNKFDEVDEPEEDDHHEPDPGWDDYGPRMVPGLASAAAHHDQAARRSPMAAKKKKKGSLTSSSSDRAARAAAGSASRTTTLTQNYRDLRTPMLNHVQLYSDAEARKPLVGIERATVEERIARHQQQHGPPPASSSSYQKQFRSHDDGLYSGYANGGSGGGPQTITAAAAAAAQAAAQQQQQRDPYSRSMSLRRTYSDDGASIRQQSLSGRTTGSANGGGGVGGSSSQVGVGAMPDFFGSATFQVVLHNPTTAHQLLKFAESRLCAENVAFLARVDEYRATLNLLATQMAAIHKTFVSPGSSQQINVPQAQLRRAHRDMKQLVNQGLPGLETVFSELQEQVETMVYQDIYPRFVRHQVALSASRALGNDRFKYQGLGDCFCLTNPNVADNPIVFASDGFVKVTGYTRAEIIPRNCRFLQGSHTDRRPIDRLKAAINERKESVELILNYKKNGDPFWNLLYVAPLYNAAGKTEFFIGGQVNCSTTIHSNVDVMKVLSLSASGDVDIENESLRAPAAAAAAQQQHPPRPSARRTLLRAFGVVKPDDPIAVPRAPVDTGMEEGLLGRMRGQELTAQMKEFYTAYSRYLVVRASSYTIGFYSEGLLDALNPAATQGGGVAIVGADVFRFLGLHMIARQTEYRTRVRNAIRAGLPASTALRLQTRRSALFRGDEAFVAHWTPLKDEQAAVQWIVVTLALAM